MDFRVLSRNISENMHARCVREDTKQALKGILQADGVQSGQTLFVRYCLNVPRCCFDGEPIYLIVKGIAKKNAIRLHHKNDAKTKIK